MTDIRRALFLAATGHLPAIGHDRMRRRMGGFAACRGMDALRVHRMSTLALSRLRLPARGWPLPLGGPVLMPLLRGFAPRLGAGDSANAAQGDQSENRLGPTIRTPHIVTPDATGHRWRRPGRM